MTDGKPARHPHPFSVLRRFRKTDLTICIPAYQAGGFIDRALRCAQGQTYGHVRILVAIDRSTDATADVCRRFASEDRRIDIVEHRERLGWCGNLNSLLERVDTRFFFLYFHDDLILPQYCEHLRDALLRSPEAASANADLVNFGKVDRIDPGRSYRGSTAQRLLESMVVPEPGALLRSMVRSSTIDKDYRLPPEEEGSVTRAPMGLRMLAAGPAVRVAEALYLRWIREGGLTDGWKKSPFDRWLDGWIQNVGRAFAIIDKYVVAEDDRHVLKLAWTLRTLQQLAPRCRKEHRRLPRPREMHPAAPELHMPPNLERFGPAIAGHLAEMHRAVVNALAEIG